MQPKFLEDIIQSEITNIRINDIIKEYHSVILLGLYFNLISRDNKPYCLGVSIKEDGESIQLAVLSEIVTHDYLKKKAYTLNSYINIKSDSLDDNLHNVVGQRLLEVEFGQGWSDIEYKDVLYYFKLKTSTNNLMFFNNGDEGMVVSNLEIENVLQHDIYHVKWSKFKLSTL